MQETDVCSIEYFGDEERFADIVNMKVFSGEQFIQPEDIQEKNRSIFMKWGRNGRYKVRTLYRDIVRLVKMQMRVVLIALENQDKIHYAMPVRVMTEDCGNYYEQWKKFLKFHKKKKDLRGAEFLSGISKYDKLIPVITIVVYFGKEPWDGPRSLKEMLDLSDLPECVRGMVVDYPIYLLEVRKIKNPEIFKSDFRWVVEFLQKEDDAQEVKRYLDENEEIFRNLDEDTYDLISIMSTSSQLQNIKKECQTEEGGVDMCRAIQEMIDEGREEGRKEGREEAEKFIFTVIRMHAKGMNVKEISKECGVPRKRIKQILNELAA